MRWLEKAQAQVMEETRKLMAQRLGLRTSEIKSMLRVMQPSIAERLSRLLAPIKR
jgi:methyl-accepting chemotaxis protein